MSEGPTAGEILVGIFLALCGLCLFLVGGGCALFWLAAMFGRGGDGSAGNYVIGILLLLVSLATLGGGAVTLWASGKMAFGRK